MASKKKAAAKKMNETAVEFLSNLIGESGDDAGAIHATLLAADAYLADYESALVENDKTDAAKAAADLSAAIAKFLRAVA